MTEQNPPLYMQQRTDHDADGDRSMLMALLQGREGVFAEGDFVTTQNGTPNMSVNVAGGRAAVQGDTAPLTQGMYLVWNDGAKNVVIAAADGTNTRKDIIVARVKDAFYTGAINAFSVESITGTPAGVPLDPVIPDGCLPLYRVTVGAGSTSVLNAAISDMRPRAAGAGGRVVCYNFTRPTSPYIGMEIFEQETGRNFIWTGALWAFQGVVGIGNTNATAVRATKPLGQVVATGTWVKIQFVTETFDPGNNFDNATNYRYVAPYAGLYLATTEVQLNGTAGDCIVALYKNGTIDSRITGYGSAVSGCVTSLMQMAAGDYIETWVYATGGGVVIPTSSGELAYISVVRLP